MKKYNDILQWLIVLGLDMLAYGILFGIAPAVLPDIIYNSGASLAIYFGVTVVISIIDISIDCKFIQIFICDLIYYMFILWACPEGAYGIGKLGFGMVDGGYTYSQDMVILTAGILVSIGLALKIIVYAVYKAIKAQRVEESK